MGKIPEGRSEKKETEACQDFSEAILGASGKKDGDVCKGRFDSQIKKLDERLNKKAFNDGFIDNDVSSNSCVGKSIFTPTVTFTPSTKQKEDNCPK